jgi:hypothetical protein
MTGRDMLHHRRVRALDDQRQHAFLALAGREADRFGRGHAGIALADDLAPAADHGGLNEAEPAKGDAADLRQQFGHGPRAQRTLRLPCFLERDPPDLPIPRSMA